MPVLKSKILVLTGIGKDVIDTLKKESLYNKEEHYTGRCWYKFVPDSIYPFQCIIHTKDNKISLIAHEAVHASSFILCDMGVVADFNNDELQAYIVQYICREVENI